MAASTATGGPKPPGFVKTATRSAPGNRSSDSSAGTTGNGRLSSKTNEAEKAAPHNSATNILYLTIYSLTSPSVPPTHQGLKRLPCAPSRKGEVRVQSALVHDVLRSTITIPERCVRNHKKTTPSTLTQPTSLEMPQSLVALTGIAELSQFGQHHSDLGRIGGLRC